MVRAKIMRVLLKAFIYHQDFFVVVATFHNNNNPYHTQVYDRTQKREREKFLSENSSAYLLTYCRMRGIAPRRKNE